MYRLIIAVSVFKKTMLRKLFSTMLLIFIAIGYMNTASANSFQTYKRSASEIERYPEIHFSLLVKALMANEVFLIDANSEQSYKKGHIPGAISLKIADFDKKLPVLKNYPIVVYCSGPACLSWMKGTKVVSGKGYTNIMVYKAGLKGWLASGRKLVSAPVPLID